jgi:hypothetical protein
MIWVAIIIGIILLFVFPKQMGMIIGLVVVGIGGAYFYFEEEAKERKRQRNSVIINISYDLNACSTGYPLHVTINNQSKKRVDKVSWNVGAFRPGYSNNIVDYGYSGEYDTPYSSDKILNSGQGSGSCYTAPAIEGDHDPKILSWSVIHKRVEFSRK